MKNSNLKVGNYLEYYKRNLNICYEIVKIEKYVTLKVVYSNLLSYQYRVGEFFECNKKFALANKRLISKEKIQYYQSLQTFSHHKL